MRQSPIQWTTSPQEKRERTTSRLLNGHRMRIARPRRAPPGSIDSPSYGDVARDNAPYRPAVSAANGDRIGWVASA